MGYTTAMWLSFGEAVAAVAGHLKVQVGSEWRRSERR
jgi:hypothetical protein